MTKRKAPGNSLKKAKSLKNVKGLRMPPGSIKLNPQPLPP